MTSNPDFLMLHPPTVYDFRDLAILYGPISDLVPSTPVFEMYPIGFSTIASHLERSGYSARIINLAGRMLRNSKFNVPETIAKLQPKAFGIDLHWLPHAHGAIEIARICKEKHPDKPVIMGGYSASYFFREIMEYEVVDFILRGDTTEGSLLMLMDYITGKRGKRPSPESIPGLVWRDKTGSIRSNPVSPSPDSLDEYPIDYGNITRSVIKYRDLESILPSREWLEYPITMAMTVKGCKENCVICGGSKWASRNMFGRRKPSFRSPAGLASDFAGISAFSRGPIFLLGDLLQPGEDYAREFLDRVSKLRIKNPVIIELFNPAPEWFFRLVNKAFSWYTVEISPETHDDRLRKRAGKRYRTDLMESTIEAALTNGARRFDIFFMIGIPDQTYSSAVDSVKYGAGLVREFGKKVVPFTSPLAPFLDPGSIAFENPDKFGYTLRFKTLEDYRNALLSPLWKDTLSYDSATLPRDELAEASYEAGLILNREKFELGLLDRKTYEKTDSRIRQATKLMHQVEKIVSSGGDGEALQKLKKNGVELSISTVCEKNEMKLPRLARNFRMSYFLKMVYQTGIAGRKVLK